MVELVIEGWIDHLQADEEEREFQAKGSLNKDTKEWDHGTFRNGICVCVLG